MIIFRTQSLSFKRGEATDFNCVTICCPIVVDAVWCNLYT